MLGETLWTKTVKHGGLEPKYVDDKKNCTQKLYTATCNTTTVGCEHPNSQ